MNLWERVVHLIINMNFEENHWEKLNLVNKGESF